MSKPVVFMFSGQGSQYYKMGMELYQNHPRFKLWMDHCSEIAAPLINASLVEVIYQSEAKSEPFDRLLYSNPALLCIEFSLAKILMEKGIQPDYLMGYSLGEISASVVGGALSLEDGIELAIDSAKNIEEDSPASGMLAIIESPTLLNSCPEIFSSCWLAGRNFHNNFVMGGLSRDIDKLQNSLVEKNIVCQRLPVNYGFHTLVMDPLEAKLKKLLKSFSFNQLNIPMYSCLESKIITEIRDDYFWDVIRYPVEFEKTVMKMNTEQEYSFIDVGPSGTLATFVKYLLHKNSQSTHLEMMNQFGRDLQSLKKVIQFYDIEVSLN